MSNKELKDFKYTSVELLETKVKQVYRVEAESKEHADNIIREWILSGKEKDLPVYMCGYEILNEVTMSPLLLNGDPTISVKDSNGIIVADNCMNPNV